MKEGKYLETAIVVPQVSNLLHGIICDFLGEKVVQHIAKVKAFEFDTGVLRLFTKRNPPVRFQGPILVAFTEIGQVKKVIDACPGADVVYVPWTPEEKDLFVKLYGATQL